MKEGIYVCRDERQNPRTALTPLVLLVLSRSEPNLELLNTNSFSGVTMAIPDDEEGFLDEDGLVKLPTPTGPITLRWPTSELLQELQPVFGEVEDFPFDVHDSEEIQERLSGYMSLGNV